MTASEAELRHDIPWDLDRLVIDLGERASPSARDALDECQSGRRATVRRVAEYVAGDRPARHVKANDWARTLQHADGRLVVVLWSSAGITHLGYNADVDRHEAGGYSYLVDATRGDPIWHEFCSAAKIADQVVRRTPSLLVREESPYLGGDSR